MPRRFIARSEKYTDLKNVPLLTLWDTYHSSEDTPAKTRLERFKIDVFHTLLDINVSGDKKVALHLLPIYSSKINREKLIGMYFDPCFQTGVYFKQDGNTHDSSELYRLVKNSHKMGLCSII